MSTRSNDSGAGNFHAFTREMWLEAKVAADYSTGMSPVMRATDHPPSGFVRDELGFGLEGPDKCGPGCRCNAIRATAFVGERRPKKRRSGADWARLAGDATAAARRAA